MENEKLNKQSRCSPLTSDDLLDGGIEEARSVETQEIERLKFMIQYALDAPDNPKIIKTILFDALNGCVGASNVKEIRAAFGVYQS